MGRSRVTGDTRGVGRGLAEAQTPRNQHGSHFRSAESWQNRVGCANWGADETRDRVGRRLNLVRGSRRRKRFGREVACDGADRASCPGGAGGTRVGCEPHTRPRIIRSVDRTAKPGMMGRAVEAAPPCSTTRVAPPGSFGCLYLPAPTASCASSRATGRARPDVLRESRTNFGPPPGSVVRPCADLPHASRRKPARWMRV